MMRKLTYASAADELKFSKIFSLELTFLVLSLKFLMLRW